MSIQSGFMENFFGSEFMREFERALNKSRLKPFLQSVGGHGKNA